MDKLKMHSPNLTEEHIRKIRDLFPGCVTEAKDEDGNLNLAVDFDLLKQELSDSIVDGPQERYHLNWPGKREALLTANAPIAKTLRPYREESVDFETTQNLFIEGDNLDALKLLQETYLGKVKMIYIDPPYNTGNDFIYEDDFAVDKSEYELASGVRDEHGNKQFEEDRWKQNSAAKGRFHSDWLSMMYPRLKLAKNLLRKDGVMFISIDDGEVAQLRKMCDEVFGEGNFVAQLVWERAFSPKNDAKFISNSHDYVLMFAKSILDFTIGRLKRTAETDSRYTNPDNDPRGPWSSSDISVKTYAAANDYPIKAPSGKIIEPPAGRCWSLSKKAFLERLEDNRIWFGPNGDNVPRIKRFLSEIREGMTPTSILFYKEVGHSQEGSQEVKKLLGDQGVFDGPKPVRLLRRLLTIANTDKDALILDFFAGSSTTAHAVMQLNAEDGGNRKFIMVQLPEPCDEKSEAFRAGYQNIAEISKERIRRAGKRIKDEKSASSLDTGFRVLKVDSSNMAEVYYTPDAVKQEMLFDNVDNIKPDRTPEDLLFQVLLDWGVELTLPICREPMHGKTVFFVDENALAACFDIGITEELVKDLAAYQPLRVVFRDNGFDSDALKINVEQIFRQLSPETEVKTI
ncbi:site-specific DNA-methyltransferase [Prosthecochloris sp. ZM]|uniref:site-specific DNA-methyltransferase n=1 Tax=Prosthecochloris sp. ZM TaxID=2283143 RepID=UPI001AC00383